MSRQCGTRPLRGTPDHIQFLPNPLKLDLAPLVTGAIRPDLQLMQEQIEKLRAQALRHAGSGTIETAVRSVAITLSRQTTRPAVGVFQPRCCLVLQGAKEVTIGERRLRYDTNNYFIASLEVPASGCIIEASASRPYIGLSLALDAEALVALISDAPAGQDSETSTFAVNPLTTQLLDAWGRLMALLDAPEDIAVLAPMIEREILYRLLQGPQGAVLRQIAQRQPLGPSASRRRLDPRAL